MSIYAYIYIGRNAHVTLVHAHTECEDRARILKQNSQLRLETPCENDDNNKETCDLNDTQKLNVVNKVNKN